jgi:hypothetical protein
MKKILWYAGLTFLYLLVGCYFLFDLPHSALVSLTRAAEQDKPPSISVEDRLLYRTQQRDYWAMQKQLADLSMILQRHHDAIATALGCADFDDNFVCLGGKKEVTK